MSNFSLGQITVLFLLLILLFGDVPKIIYKIKNNVFKQSNPSNKKNRKKGT